VLKNILIMMATVFLVRGLWLVSAGETLDLHSGQQFTGHLIDFAEALNRTGADIGTRDLRCPAPAAQLPPVPWHGGRVTP